MTPEINKQKPRVTEIGVMLFMIMDYSISWNNNCKKARKKTSILQKPEEAQAVTGLCQIKVLQSMKPFTKY